MKGTARKVETLIEPSLKDSEARYRRLFEAAQDGILILDAKTGMIEDVNPYLIKMLGYSREEFIKKKLWEVGAFKDIEASQDAFEALQENEYIRYEDLPLRAKGGRLIQVEFVSNVYSVGNEKVIQCNIRDITERKQAEAGLQESDARYRSTLESMMEGCQIIGYDWRYLFINDSAAGQGKLKKEELLGHTMMECYPGIEKTDMFAVLRRCMDERTSHIMMNEFIYPDGSRGWFELSIQPSPNGIFILSSDITERKRAEEALSESRAQLAGIIDTAMNAIITADTDQRILGFNLAAEKMFGYPAAHAIGQPLALLLPNRFRGTHREQVAGFGDDGKTTRTMENLPTLAGVRANGEEFPVEISISRAEVAGKQLYTAIVRDITERKQADEALRASKLIIEGIINAIPVRVFWKDKDLVYLGCNAVFARDAGFTDPKDVIGKDDYQMVWHDQAELYRGDDRQVIESGSSKLHVEEPQTTPEGNIITLLTSKVPLRSSKGEVIGVLGTYMDITERKRAEDALRESEERYRLLVETLPVGVVAHSQGRVVFANPASATIIGAASPADLTGMPVIEFVHPDYRELALKRIQQSLSEGSPALLAEEKFVRLDGTLIDIEVSAIPFSYAGKPAMLTVFNDITEHKQEKQEIASLAKFPSENPNPVLRLSGDGIVMYANAASGALLGMWGCAVGGTAPQFWRALAAQALASRENKTVDIECDGKVYSMFVTPVAEPGYVNLYGRDITERKQAEQALRRSEEKYRDLVNALNDGVFVSDDRGVLTFANQALARIHGFEHPEELVGRTFIEFVAPAMVGNIAQLFRESIQSGTTSETIEAEIIRANGIGAFIEVKPVPIVEDGKVMGIRGVVRDITERKQREEQMTRLNMAVNNSGEAIFMTDREGVITFVNPGFTQLYGYTADEIVGKTTPRILKSGVMKPEDYAAFWQILLNKHVAKGELTNKTKDGPLLNVESWSSPILNQQEEVIGFLSLQRDITQRKQAEERIRRQLEHLTALRAIDRVIAGNFDLGISLSEILTHVTIELGIDAADILILNSNSPMLEYGAERGFRTKAVRKTQVRLGESYAGRAILERQLVQIPNLKGAPDNLFMTTLLTDEDFVCYYGVPLIAKGQVKGVLEVFHRTALEPDKEWFDFLNTLAGQAAIAIENSTLFENLQRSNSELILAYDATIEGWSHALDLRDKETEGHTQRVTEMTVKLARTFGLSEVELVQVRWGALLHDIGKMGVPDGILFKPGPLTDEEWVVMKRHPVLAYEMLSPIRYLRLALDIPYCHHEKWDGTGYPRGLKGEQNPLTARIFAVVDVWDALNSDRPYRAAWPEEKVLDYIRSLAGTHFDSQIVKICLESGLLKGQKRP